MTKAEFAARLKEWRISQNLTQRKLGELLNKTISTIKGYEKMQTVPPYEVAVKLAGFMGIDYHEIPYNRHEACNTLDKPFTDEERQFAEKNHKLVLWFLNSHHLCEDEWYDVVVFGYLQSIKIWFAREDLHKYSFSNIAYKHMSRFVHNEKKKKKRYPETISIYDVIPGTEDMQYIDMLCDINSYVGV